MSLVVWLLAYQRRVYPDIHDLDGILSISFFTRWTLDAINAYCPDRRPTPTPTSWTLMPPKAMALSPPQSGCIRLRSPIKHCRPGEWSKIGCSRRIAESPSPQFHSDLRSIRPWRNLAETHYCISRRLGPRLRSGVSRFAIVNSLS